MSGLRTAGRMQPHQKYTQACSSKEKLAPMPSAEGDPGHSPEICSEVAAQLETNSTARVEDPAQIQAPEILGSRIAAAGRNPWAVGSLQSHPLRLRIGLQQSNHPLRM